MYLYNEQWDEAADMASQVIGHYGLELCPSLKDLWADDKTNNEFIWTTEFTEDDAFRQANGYWSWYAMYIDRFPGVQTMLKWTGYGGCQAIPSTYFMDLFDRDADKRWSDLHQWVLQRPGQRPLGLPAQPVARIHRHGALPLPRRAAAGRA